MTEFEPRRDVQAISHLNVVVEDLDLATEFYSTVLGFERASNADGSMDYPGVNLSSFARDAGFEDGRVDVDIRLLAEASRDRAIPRAVHLPPPTRRSDRPSRANLTAARCPRVRFPRAFPSAATSAVSHAR